MSSGSLASADMAFSYGTTLTTSRARCSGRSRTLKHTFDAGSCGKMSGLSSSAAPRTRAVQETGLLLRTRELDLDERVIAAGAGRSPRRRGDEKAGLDGETGAQP